MRLEEKKIQKLTLSQCKSAVRKLNRENDEMFEEMGYIESGIYANEQVILKVKERIKKLTPKK